MEPQIRVTQQEQGPRISPEAPPPPTSGTPPPPHDSSWLILGDHGLRCGWSALFFIVLYYLLSFLLDIIVLSLDPSLAENPLSPVQMFIGESIPLSAILVAGSFMARVESRRLAEYNLIDSRPVRHFVGGLLTGFAALSALIACLAMGGWLRFGHPVLHGGSAFGYGALWGGVFLVVGLFEEGSFRCYLLYTLTRGINFWWALSAVAGLSLLLILSSDPKGSGGVFCIAALGVVPCWLLHHARVASSSFWQATWATSTGFAFFHTSNNGENAIGIFAAALVGVVFCASVRLTGSAWWAIGCHAAWDWAETYFYGTPDSGFLPQHHLLATTPTGNVLWSGGTDGPEGSLLVFPVILLLLAFLIFVFRRAHPHVARLGTERLTIDRS
jgi:uncharacterized protein